MRTHSTVLAALACLAVPLLRGQCFPTTYDAPVRSGTIGSAQTHCYSFFGNANDRVRLSRSWNGNVILLVTDVRGPNGPVAFADHNTLQLDFTLTTTGTHTLWFRDRDNYRVGGYGFQLQLLSNPVRTRDLCYSFNPTPGSIGTAVQEDCYRFQIRKDRTAQITKVWNGNVILLVAEIIDSSGKRVGYIDHNTQIADFKAPADGAYHVLVRDRDLYRLGSYSIKLTCPTFDCYCVASSQSYGMGWPGTNGRVPGLSLSAPPRIGGHTTLQLSSSSGRSSPALLAIGLQRAETPTAFGGTLLVNPTAWASLVIDGAGGQMTFALPSDQTLCDLCLFLQTLQIDVGASHGLAFSRGLHMTLGY